MFALPAAVELEEYNVRIVDVNDDGIVAATDTRMMLRQVVGLGDVFNCPGSERSEATTTTTMLPESV